MPTLEKPAALMPTLEKAADDDENEEPEQDWRALNDGTRNT